VFEVDDEGCELIEGHEKWSGNGELWWRVVVKLWWLKVVRDEEGGGGKFVREVEVVERSG
jgi:hypothetical protein